ncbi:MAG: (2Fe-2S)-binding protein [Betaproteobacteria bacterium HGW-Betaproteobacteria-1]|jgi:NAD(P)H-nitrite reductase large subunit|nr:MAG: (2Fe-2S)-binding protein [Betaproteobacteria bacterium HGW-Betaproteobacteria-1]
MSNGCDNPDDEIMCSCSGTRRGQIRAYFLQGLDADAISRKTGALSGCGGCEWDIGEYLQALAAEAAAGKPAA